MPMGPRRASSAREESNMNMKTNEIRHGAHAVLLAVFLLGGTPVLAGEALSEPPAAGLASVNLAVTAPSQSEASAQLYTRRDGAQVQAAIRIEINDGWHLYHTDLGDPEAMGKPLSIELSGTGIEWGEPRLPKPTREDDEVFGTWAWIHHGTIVVRVDGVLSGEGDGSDVAVILKGLTCEDAGGLCLPFGEELESAGEGEDEWFAATASTEEDGLGEHGAGSTPPRAANPPSGAMEVSLGAFLLMAVGWALFTLLMPCTYPMIPITISFFTKQAADRGGRVLPLSLAYGAGIVAIFIAIGVVVGPVIIRFATHPVTNLIIGGLFVVFALSLFGLFDLKPPRFLMSAAGSANARGGYVGVFLMGMTLVVTSFTCTAPFVGSLLSVGAVGGGLGRLALGMGVFGLTMALPFVALSLVPGKLQSMPKSGEWMHLLKVTLGFVELAAALKFISNADLVWGWGLLSREAFLVMWLGIMLMAALFLAGVIRLRGESGEGISPGRLVASTCFLLFGLYCGYGALGHSLDPVMTAIVPNYSNHLGGTGQSHGTAASHTIIKDDYAGALAQARERGQRLLVNFTGFT